MKHLIIALSAVVALALSSACSKQETPKTPGADVVATVNGHEITRAVFDAYTLAHTRKNAKDLGATEKAKVLDDLIEMVLIAEAPGTEDAAAKAVIEAQVELTRLSLKAQRNVEDMLKVGPTDQELKAEYEAQIKLMASANEFLTRHIVVDSKDKADAVIGELKGGADFLKLAKQHSADQQSQQGVVFWVGTGPQDKPFADAVRALKKGDVTPAPVQSQFGWHVIRLEDTRPVTAPDFEGAKAELKEALQRKKVRAAIDALKKTAKTDKRI